MTEENKKNNPIENHIQTEQAIYQNDEIDLRELFFILWKKKVLILSFTFIATILGAIYASVQPNIYESKAVLKVSRGHYGALNVASLDYLVSDELKQEIDKNSDVSIIDLNISFNNKTKEISVSKKGKDAQVIYDQVVTYSENVGRLFLQHELESLRAQVVIAESLLKKQLLDEVKKVIAENYASLIYREAILKSGSVELVKLTKKAVKPTSHIKPKRALIVVLSTLLAGMLSVFIALTHHYFRQDKT